MTTTLKNVVDAIETLLDGLDEELHVEGYVPGSSLYPAAFLHPVPATDYRDGAADGQTHVYDIIVLVSAGLFENAHDVLPYIERSGDQSIFAAFEANRTLGLPGVDAHVRESRPLDLQEIAGYGGSGAAVTLVVYLAAD